MRGRLKSVAPWCRKMQDKYCKTAAAAAAASHICKINSHSCLPIFVIGMQIVNILNSEL